MQSLLNAMTLDLVRESRATHRPAVGRCGGYRVSAVCLMNGVRVHLFDEGNRLLDVAWSPSPSGMARAELSTVSGGNSVDKPDL
jgi:hypothetical protein